MRHHLSFYVPERYKNKLPTVSGILLYKMPRRPKAVERVIAVGRSGTIAITVQGRVYIDTVRPRGCYRFISERRIAFMRVFKALADIGAIPEEEYRFIEALDQKLATRGKLVEDLRFAGKLLERSGLEIPGKATEEIARIEKEIEEIQSDLAGSREVEE